MYGLYETKYLEIISSKKVHKLQNFSGFDQISKFHALKCKFPKQLVYRPLGESSAKIGDVFCCVGALEASARTSKVWNFSHKNVTTTREV